jgi:Zn finger protein HypA/HybF involved in hydrogenase expression
MKPLNSAAQNDGGDEMQVNIKFRGFKCLRCGHEWVPNRHDAKGHPIPPKVCPKCASPYWDKPRGQKRGPKPRGEK